MMSHPRGHHFKLEDYAGGRDKTFATKKAALAWRDAQRDASRWDLYEFMYGKGDYYKKVKAPKPKKRNPTGTLRGKGKRQWEHVYESQRARKLSPARAAASAWSVVKKTHKKVGGVWRTRNGSPEDHRREEQMREYLGYAEHELKELREGGDRADAAVAQRAIDSARKMAQRVDETRARGQLERMVAGYQARLDRLTARNRARNRRRNSGSNIAIEEAVIVHERPHRRNRGRGTGQMSVARPSTITRNGSKIVTAQGTWRTFRYTPPPTMRKVVKPSWAYRIPGGAAQTGFADEASAATAMRKHANALASIRKSKAALASRNGARRRTSAGVHNRNFWGN